MVPTALAQNLAEPVKDILQRTHSVVNTRPQFNPAEAQRRFSISVSDYVAIILFPAVNRALAEQAPGIQISLRQTPIPQARVTHPVTEALDRRNNDFAIIPEEYHSESHSREPIMEDTYSCIAWNENKFIEDTLSLENYQKLNHAITEFDDGRIHARESLAIEHLGYKRSIGTITESFSQLPDLIVGTQMIATVQTRLAKLYSKRLPLKILKSPVEIPNVVEIIQWHKFRDYDQAMIWFRALLQNVAEKL